VYLLVVLYVFIFNVYLMCS